MSPRNDPRTDVVSREALGGLLMSLEDQRPLLAYMALAIHVHEQTEAHRCHNAACAQVAEFKAVLLACEFRQHK